MKMLGIVLAMVLLATGLVSGQDETYTPVKREDARSLGETMRYGLGRGFVNLCTCWLEIPRNLSYEATARPISSPLLGPIMGASYTAMRAVYGVVDLLSGGYTGYYSYADILPDYPWEAKWVADSTQFD